MTRLKIEPIEVWAWNNAENLFQLAHHRYSKHIAFWKQFDTTPDREWWRGFWSAIFTLGLTYIFWSLVLS